MARCPEMVCGYEVPGLQNAFGAVIGCTKYSRHLMEVHPTFGYQAAFGQRHRQPYRATLAQVPTNLASLIMGAGHILCSHGTGRLADE